jgi:ATP-dependent DNA helicase RecG
MNATQLLELIAQGEGARVEFKSSFQKEVIETLAALVKQGESATLEFKKSTAEKERACRTLCAFANGQGGQLVFGVTPSGKVVGQLVTDRTLEELAQEFQGFEPPLNPSIERVALSNGHEALLVHVSRRGTPPFTFRGVPYERVLNTTRVMPRESHQRLIIESVHATIRWETEPAAGWRADQLDQSEILATIEEAIRRGRCEDPGSRDSQSILRGLGLLLPDGALSRAALALFCPDDVAPSDFPHFKLRLARFKGTTRDEFLDNRQYAGNAFALMRRAGRFLIDWLPVASKIVPGQMARIDTPALPTEATREALANAFIHRDYASAAGSVAVALYDDRLEVISSGGLHFGLTPAMLFKPHESNPWNPWIANVFYRRGYIETRGRGTLKIASLMQNAGLQAPTVVENTGFVIMTFVIPDKNVVRQPESEGVNGGVNEGVNEGVNALTEHIRRHPGLRTPALAALMKTAPKNVERWLKQLRQADKIVFVGSPKTGGYQPK